MINMGKRQINEERESMKVRKNMEAMLKQMSEQRAVLQIITKPETLRLSAKFFS